MKLNPGSLRASGGAKLGYRKRSRICTHYPLPISKSVGDYGACVGSFYNGQLSYDAFQLTRSRALHSLLAILAMLLMVNLSASPVPKPERDAEAIRQTK